MSETIRFDDQVAIVTGAGAGLGRSHALEFARRGARVVVNDLGSDPRGAGRCSEPADAVVAEIEAFGGEAVASYDSVENGNAIVQTALDNFDRVDVVVNNAGFLRDASFKKMTDEDWDRIYRVHALGTYRVTHAAWPYMLAQGFGRIVNTTSAAGIFGNFGQANYAFAKLGVVGFTRTLALEGAANGVLANVISPIAGSRLTATILPQEVTEALKPEYVTPLVVKLCDHHSRETGGLFEVGAGWIAKLRWQRTQGAKFPIGEVMTAEQIDAAWEVIDDFEQAEHPQSTQDTLRTVFKKLGLKLPA